MIRSMYQAASAMMAQMARQLNISNNLANVSTPGYKEATLAVDDFHQLLLSRVNSGGSATVGGLSTAVRLDDPQFNLAQGALIETGNVLDLAIAGDAFFAIQTSDGTQYTRNGQFKLSADRQLVTNDGLPVLGEAGPIVVPEGEVFVDSDGTVRAGDQVAGRLLLAEFDDTATIEAAGNSRFRIAGASTVSQTAGVSQGFLEGSNVDLNQATVDMMAATRSYQIAQQMLSMSDQTLAAAVNEIGKIA